MKAVLQRVSMGRVIVDQKAVGAIGRGIVALVGIEKSDTAKDAEWLAKKVANLRILDDEAGKMNLSCVQLGLPILCISQFTLCASVEKGQRPSFDAAMPPAQAKELFDYFVERLGESVTVQTGVFRAEMKVELCNEGPVTIWIDSRNSGMNGNV